MRVGGNTNCNAGVKYHENHADPESIRSMLSSVGAISVQFSRENGNCHHTAFFAELDSLAKFETAFNRLAGQGTKLTLWVNLRHPDMNCV